MKLLYKAEIIDEDTGEVLGRISSYDPTGLEHEMHKLEGAAQRVKEEEEQRVKEQDL